MSTRWIASITYRGAHGATVVDYDIEELFDLHDIVEAGPDWRTIMDITIQLMEPDENVFLPNLIEKEGKE